ncbi:sigma factor sigX-regulated lipoprotein SrpA [Leptospira borgpetersenii]|uniref:sigma factor sigX-regulated lipoprotein SrpA n=1 Tax=Leptospira borgpetersenii TaxID=174 RepID=UPI000773A0BC|nr:hypothetical protein [Leptospira borgpetersenii]MBE8364345.1 hypothetical protein [Leptospira borgpetersenii serovar Balcanica]MBE8367158.1 hypothetical protein [Leptospira borgpetersenii serovar Balcanica]MBE8399965.1 hypothetical protein [Leptospira borgpetersenii serovar Tarassovi]MBE8403200.1 hypothetical protein [Leptospira borgpetersenii serovar Tarassovi]MBE8406306.1 hypothetical protein [Leptospira borgpetersenii serovar Tarassovi]
MKQNKNQLQRGTLAITAFAITALFLVTNCKKEKDDNKELLLMAALLSGPNGKAEFKFSNTTNLLAARTKDSSRFLTLPDAVGQGSAFLTDLAGDNPQNYGDGNGDGFNDKFLTPEAAEIQICQIVAYKSVEKGGPARGSETLQNANFVSFNMTGPFGSGVCTAFAGKSITGLGGTMKTTLPINQIPQNEKEDYDRIGLVIRAFRYYFNPNDIPENAYRYVDLILNKPTPPAFPGMEDVVFAERGDVSPVIFDHQSPQSFVTSPSLMFPELLPQNELKPYSFFESFIDASSGSLLKMPDGTSTNAAFGFNSLNPAENYSGVLYTNNSQKLKFKLPTSAKSLKKDDPYILVVDLNNTKGEKGNLLFNVSVDKVLFWDSASADNIFSPQLDAADRPNATNGEDNLATTARKNLIFHLPTIRSETK